MEYNSEFSDRVGMALVFLIRRVTASTENPKTRRHKGDVSFWFSSVSPSKTGV
jgi:hypothetical protein